MIFDFNDIYPDVDHVAAPLGVSRSTVWRSSRNGSFHGSVWHPSVAHE